MSHSTPVMVPEATPNNDWLPQYMASDLLALSLPARSDAALFESLQTHRGKGRVINDDGILTLRRLPSVGAILKAKQELSNSDFKGDGHEFVVFSQLGTMSREGLRRLDIRSTLINFAAELQEGVEWLFSFEQEEEYQAWLTERVLGNNTNTMNHIFRPAGESGAAIKMPALLTLAEENYLNDKVIQGVMQVFNADSRGRFLYLMPLRLQGMIDHINDEVYVGWDYCKEPIQTGTIEAAYALVHMNGNHWGLACINFFERRVYFGDSMDNGQRRLPLDAEQAIWKWLSRVTHRSNTWIRNVLHLEMPQQNEGSGSCGVISLNMMERMVGGDVDQWSVSTSKDQRLRLLKILTGFERVSSFTHLFTNVKARKMTNMKMIDSIVIDRCCCPNPHVEHDSLRRSQSPSRSQSSSRSQKGRWSFSNETETHSVGCSL